MAGSSSMSRRVLLNWLLGGLVALSGVAIIGPIIKFLFPPSEALEASGSRVSFGKEEEILPGGSKTVIYKNQPALIINAKGGFVAVSAVCTHMGCFLRWNEKTQMIECPCHDAAFDINGAVLSGPPPAPLPAYRVEVLEGKVYLGG